MDNGYHITSTLKIKLLYLDFIYHHLLGSSLLLSCVYIFYRLGCLLLISYLGLKANFCQAFNHSKSIPNIYIHQFWLFWIIRQNFYYPTSTLANTNSLLVWNFCYLANTFNNTNNMPKVYLYYLASILININGLPKIDPCHLVNILTNTNDKVDNFTKEKVWLNLHNCLLFVPWWYVKIITLYVDK